MSARMDRLEFYREAVALGSEYVLGDWRWALVAAENGKTIGASTEGYRRRIDAVKNAARVLGVAVDLLAGGVRHSAAKAGPAYVINRISGPNLLSVPLYVVVRSYNAPVKVGDPAFRPSGYGEGEDCCARHIFGWFCCLPDGHEGEHVANGLTEVAAVWS